MLLGFLAANSACPAETSVQFVLMLFSEKYLMAFIPSGIIGTFNDNVFVK